VAGLRRSFDQHASEGETLTISAGDLQGRTEARRALPSRVTARGDKGLRSFPQEGRKGYLGNLGGGTPMRQRRLAEHVREADREGLTGGAKPSPRAPAKDPRTESTRATGRRQARRARCGRHARNVRDALRREGGQLRSGPQIRATCEAMVNRDREIRHYDIRRRRDRNARRDRDESGACLADRRLAYVRKDFTWYADARRRV